MSKNPDLNYNLIAFVLDPASSHIVHGVVKDTNMPFCEIMTGDIEQCIPFLRDNKTPKILVIDISNSDLPLNDITKIHECSTPNLNIIAIGGKNEVGLYRDLLDMGVSDYLVKPINKTILQNAIDAINGTKEKVEQKVGKMIACIGSVGGAGSTTIATNIAWILANKHFKKTSIIDLDFLLGSVNLLIDLKAENSYLEMLESPDKIDEYFVETILKKIENRLYYLGGLSDIIHGSQVNHDSFAALLKMVKTLFNYVVADIPRDFSDTSKICLAAANTYIIVAEYTMTSAQNTSRLLEYFIIEQPSKRVIIVANKVGFASVSALPKETFEKVIDRKVEYELQCDEIFALMSANLGQLLAKTSSPAVLPLEKIAQDVLGKIERLIEEEEVAPSGVLDKIKDAFKSKNKK